MILHDKNITVENNHKRVNSAEKAQKECISRLEGADTYEVLTSAISKHEEVEDVTNAHDQVQ